MGAQREEATMPASVNKRRVADRAEWSLLGTSPRSDTERAASWDMQTLRSIRKSHLWGGGGAGQRAATLTSAVLPLCWVVPTL